MQRYEFEFAPQFRRFLLGFGVRPERTGVTLDGGWVIARFGPWVVETPVTNIKEVTVTGPYRWWRVFVPKVRPRRLPDLPRPGGGRRPPRPDQAPGADGDRVR